MENQSKISKLGKIIAKQASTLITFSCATLSVAGLLYVVGALSYGANPLKPQDYWQKRRDFDEQRKVQKEQEIRDYSKKQFHEIDKNNNLVIDPNEFYNYIRENREKEF